MRSRHFIRQLLVALGDGIEVPNVFEVLDDSVELRPDLCELLHRIGQAVLDYVYHLVSGWTGF